MRGSQALVEPLLFDQVDVPTLGTPDSVSTEGIKYSGSKLKLLPHILEVALKVNADTVFDGFSGTTRVSQAFAQTGHRVIASDHAEWSEVFAKCYLQGNDTPELHEKLRYLNSLPGTDGWFTENYGGDDFNGSAIQPDGQKRPWQRHNTQKLDAIRPAIDEIAEDEIQKAILLTSLIRALDAVDSSLGHFVSYLKKWAPRSYKTMKLKVPKMHVTRTDHSILKGDIFDVLPDVTADLAYFDPPYGSNNEKMPPSRVRYASYYHLWKTICLNDQPKLTGVARRRADASDKVAGSVFEEFRRDDDGHFIATKAIERLIAECKAPHILLSYNNGGRATKEEIFEIMRRSADKVDLFSFDHRRNVMAGMRWTNDWIREDEGKNTEYLFLLHR